MSNINYAIIDETFPVAGQDNDTETFRRNFDSIKTNFRYAQEEIESLQNNTAKTNDQVTDFNKNKITNAVLANTRFAVQTRQTPAAATQGIEFQTAHYHVYSLSQSTNFTFTLFPGDPGEDVSPYESGGRVTLELYKQVGASNITVEFLSTGSGVSKIYLNDFPSYPLQLTVDNETKPVMVEIIRHNKDDIFIKYLGTFKDSSTYSNIDSVSKLKSLTTTQRNALVGVEVGMIILNTTTTKVQVATQITPSVVWTDLN